MAPSRMPVLERYRALLADEGEAFPITLGEGDTPLVHARRLGAELGLSNLHLKFEGTNPTGSFKDRGMVLAVNRAVANGARAIVCASTGNTSASAAAYAAAAGLPCHVILPAGKVARGKLAQALAAGARLTMVDGNFDAALTAVRRLGEEGAAVVVNSINPDRLEGQQDRRVGDRRQSGARSGRPGAPGRERRQHHGLLAQDSSDTTVGGPACSASRRRGSSIVAVPGRRRRRQWRPRFASATRPPGRARRPRATSQPG